MGKQLGVSFLDAALAYAEMGWPIFPTNAAKKPRTQHGLLDATTSREQILRWWGMWPTANIAVRTGAESGIVVLDVDSYKHGALDALHDLEMSYSPLPYTVEQQTGRGGRQIFFQHPGTPVPCVTDGRLGVGIDVKGDGGYVLIPPSVTERQYTWVLEHDLSDTPLSPFPDWLQGLLKPLASSFMDHAVVQTPIPEGSRNGTLFKYGSSLRAMGLDEAHVYEALCGINTLRCHPPLPDADIRVLAHQAARYTAGTRSTVPSYTGASPPSAPAITQSISVDPSLVPELPVGLGCIRPAWQTWLDDYVAYSVQASPRAAPSFHRSIGLWVLSVVAARRIVVPMGPTPIYPSLYVALAAESTIWSKSTAAACGTNLLRRSGCSHLLAPDRVTPQYLLKTMAGIVPKDYGAKSAEAQEQIRIARGFAAQRGWFYEEWGGMLQNMRRVDSPMAELNKLLLVLDGGQDTFETATIQRGLEHIDAPYLALLGCATPADFAPFMAEGDPWWNNGFWPRFAFATPPRDSKPSSTFWPRDRIDPPGNLIISLHDWHCRLGSPTVQVTEGREPNGRMTGEWLATVSQFPSHEMTLADDVYEAWKAYNAAMIAFAEAEAIPRDLVPWYGRAHMKALRVAMLLASVHGAQMVTLPYWQEGQCMAEEWRANLHELVGTVSVQEAKSKEAKLEDRIESLLARQGAMLVRNIRRSFDKISSEMLMKTLLNMERSGRVYKQQEGRGIWYQLEPGEEI